MENISFFEIVDNQSFLQIESHREKDIKRETSLLKISSFSMSKKATSSSTLEKSLKKVGQSSKNFVSKYHKNNPNRKYLNSGKDYVDKKERTKSKTPINRPNSAINDFRLRNVKKFQSLLLLNKENTTQSNSSNTKLTIKLLFPLLPEANDTTENHLDMRKMICFKDVYRGRPKIIYFGEKTENLELLEEIGQNPKKKFTTLKFKALESCTVVNDILNSRGFRPTKGKNWNVIWGFVSPDVLPDLKYNQKVNHFPGCWNLGRKDSLLRFFLKIQRSHSTEFNYIPQTFLLQNEEKRFEQYRDSGIWIIKPCAMSRGRGIRMLKPNSSLPKKNKKNYLISKYIDNPHLIDGYKYDLRIYVLVTSFEPLILYIYDEGLVRFATSPFSKKKKNLSNIYAHITNFSINKNSPNYNDTDEDGKGSKWSLEKLKNKYNELGISFDNIFAQIKDIAIKTCISVENEMLLPVNRMFEHRKKCFELYGFDILVDSNFKAWLLEVNVSPSLQTKSFVDKKVKYGLISDLLNIIGIEILENNKDYSKLSKESFTGQNLSTLKNINNIDDLVNKLKLKDWDSLIQLEEEFQRKGNFERVFPNKENIEYYSKFFVYQKFSNNLIWKYLESSQNYIDELIKMQFK